jgi:hypothetical protein
MRKLKGGQKSHAGAKYTFRVPGKRTVLDNSPDPYQKRAFFASEPTSNLYDVVKGGFQRKNLLGKA